MTTATLPTPVKPTVSHAALVARMKAIVGPDNVLTSAAEMRVYKCNGFTIEKHRPDVFFPTTAANENATPLDAVQVQACTSNGF